MTPPSQPSLGASPSRATDERDPLIGAELGGFRVTRRLAEGGMGLVYEALHDAIGRRAAVKVLKPEVAQDSEWTKRFLTEARALGALKHKNLVEILNFGRTPDGREFLMMEFLDGTPLDVMLAEQGSLPVHVALSIADQVANGLSEAHKKGIVHRDLKPSNVHLLREHNGELLVKLLDFGLARQDPIALTNDSTVRVDQTSLLAGTPEYIAPEQALGKSVDAAADLYSLGVLLFEMLTGERPFTGNDVQSLLQAHLSTPPPAIGTLVDHLPEGLEALVDSLLAKDPAARPHSADALRVDLSRMLKQLSREQTAVRPRPSAPAVAPTKRVASVKTTPPAAPSRAKWLAVPALAAVVIAGLVVARHDDPEPAPALERPAPPPVPEPLAVVATTPTPPVPTPPVPIPPAPAPEPEPEAALAPLPKLTAPPPKATCTPSPDWKTRLTLDIAEMGNSQRVVADPTLYDVWDQRQASLSRQIEHATTPAQCASAQQAYDKLRAQLGFR